MTSRNSRTRNTRKRLLLAFAIAGVLALSMTALPQAQAPQTPPPERPQIEQPPVPPAPPTPPEIPDPPGVRRFPFERDDPFRQGIVRVSRDYLLNEGDRVREVVVVWGNATIRGQVDRDVVVVMGTATVAETGSIGQSLVIVGGQGVVAPGARIGGDLVAVGASLEAPPDFVPGREYVVIDPPILGSRLAEFFPWITRGLIWGRLIVPSLPWNWVVVGMFFVLYAALNAVADPPVRAIATVLVSKPLTAFGAGLLVLLLFGPVSALLAVSVIGIPIIPFLTCAALLAGLLGRVASMRWMGMRLTGDLESGTPAAALRAFVIGFVVLTLIYMVPIFAIITWASVGVLGLGAATLAFVDHYRRERPAKSTPEPTPGPGGGPTYLTPEAKAESSAYSEAPDLNVRPAFGGEAQLAGPPGSPSIDAAAAASAASAASLSGAPPGARTPGATNGSTFPLAEFRDRLAAGVLDLILVAVVVQLFDSGDESPRFIFLGFVAYNVAFWAWKQTTVGGIICQLRVVRANGQPFTIADAIVRGLSSIFSLVVVGLGYLWILRDPDRQAWHDKIAGTYVVKVPRNYPL